jgi:hypothetical protein
VNNTLNDERANFGHYRDLTLGLLLALAISFGVALLLRVHSGSALAFDIPIALGCFAVAIPCVLATPHKLQVLATAFGIIVAYTISSLLFDLMAARSPLARIAEVGLGATVLYLDPPGLRKRYYGFVLAAALILHGTFQLFSR